MNLDLDQHFMIDQKLIKKIVAFATIKPNETVLEIGSGEGTLTRELAKKAKVISIDIDENLAPYLKDIPNTEIKFTNALTFLKNNNHFDKIVANIPYMISEPLLNKLKHTKFKRAILTVGTTFAKKITGETESKIGITSPLFFKIKKLIEIPKTAFKPIPKTTSTVIQIEPKIKLTKEEKILKSFFIQEDKLAKNALRETLITHKNITKREAKEEITKLKLNLNKSIKLLSLNEVKKIKALLL